MLYYLFGRRAFVGQLRYQLFDRHYSHTLRVSLVVMCITLTLLSTYLFRDSRLSGRDFLPGLLPVLLGVGLAGAVIFYHHLATMVLLILPVSTLLADGIDSGTGTKITFTLILLIGLVVMWLFHMLIVERRITVRPSPANIPAVIFIMIVVLSTIWSSIFVDQPVSYLFDEKLFPRLMTAIALCISPSAYFLFANHVRSINRIKFIVWWFIVIGAVFGLLRLTGLMLPMFNNQGQFPTWTVAFAAGQCFFNRNLHQSARIALLSISSLWFYFTIGLGITWLSGWVPLCFAVFVLIFLYSRRLFLIVLLAVSVYFATNQNLINSLVGAESTESGDERNKAWERALNIYDDHYLFGTGPAGYAFYFATYLGPVGFSHNNYIDIISQTGLFGFVSFIAFWICVIIMAVRAYFRSPPGSFNQGAAGALLAANLSTLVTMALGDWVTPFTYTQGLRGIDYTIWAWIIAGTTVALYYANENTASQPRREILSA